MVSSRRRAIAAVVAAGSALAAVTVTTPFASAAVAPVRFAEQQAYPTGAVGGSGPHETSTVAADFTSDGAADIVLTETFNPAATGPLIMRNRGDGTFQSPGQRIVVGPQLGLVFAGDLNHDGQGDLVTRSWSGTVFASLGNGDGTFRAPSSVPSTPSVQIGGELFDLNRDGNLDFVVNTPNGLQSFLGTGTGTFTTGPASGTGTVPLAIDGIAAGHLDRDGIPDLVVTDAAAQRVVALKGNGSGVFTTTGSQTSVLVPGNVATGDFNGDGLDDAAVVNEFNPPGTSLAVLFSNGTGGFQSPRSIDGGFNPSNVGVGDFNRDGTIDIVSSDTSGSRQIVQLSDGRGNFVKGADPLGPLFPQTPVMADYDRNGWLDIAVVGANFGNSTLGVLRNIT